jgi:hypothetical protein
MTTIEAPATPKTRQQGLSDEAIAYLIAAALVTVGASMTTIFGLPGLAMTALTLVPVVYVVLLLITVGK